MTASRQNVLRSETALAFRRFNAWWEGYAFDAAAEALDIERALRRTERPDREIPQLIWGRGREEPGDPAWTMRHARLLGLDLKARVVVLGAALGGPIRDLKHGARWKVSGYARIREKVKGLDVAPYESALARINRASADGGLAFFELHRDADPAMIALFAAEIVRPNAPFAFVDFTTARKGARLKSCFDGPWGGSPRQTEQFAELLEKSGFRIADAVDETRAFLPLVSRGWAHWRDAYSRALRFSDRRARADYLRLLAAYAHLWAERFDAIKAGQLQVTRILARKKA